MIKKFIAQIKQVFNQPKFHKGETVRVITGELFGAYFATVEQVIKNDKGFRYKIGTQNLDECTCGHQRKYHYGYYLKNKCQITNCGCKDWTPNFITVEVEENKLRKINL